MRESIPITFVAGVLRCLVFPRLRGYHAPSDRLGRTVVDRLVHPTETRARLIEGIYLTREPTNAIGRLEERK